MYNLRHPTKAELHNQFQAKMWREYVRAWDGGRTSTGVGRDWVEHVLRISRATCLKKAVDAIKRNAECATTKNQSSSIKASTP